MKSIQKNPRAWHKASKETIKKYKGKKFKVISQKEYCKELYGQIGTIINTSVSLDNYDVVFIESDLDRTIALSLEHIEILEA